MNMLVCITTGLFDCMVSPRLPVDSKAPTPAEGLHPVPAQGVPAGVRYIAFGIAFVPYYQQLCSAVGAFCSVAGPPAVFLYEMFPKFQEK